MPKLGLSLLGSPQIKLDGIPLKLSTQRALPLIAFLAITGKSQSRETLANLLWSDSPSQQGLASLRTTLWRMKSIGLDEWVRMDHEQISLVTDKSIEMDVTEFKANLEKCNHHGHPPTHTCLYCIAALTEAVEQYHGEFMAGFNLSNAQVFEDWQAQESEILHVQYIEALEKLVKGHRTFGDFTHAIQFARILLSYDRFNESAQMDLLQLLQVTGQRAAAISQYRHFRDFISRELGIEPSQEMTTLYKQILSGRSAPKSSQKLIAPIFMIADIENFENYWNEAKSDKKSLLASYQEIFIETARRFGGLILQKFEDNVTILFENGHPLHCAVTIFLRLQKINWGELPPPRVRMVLYSASIDSSRNRTFATIAQIASSLLSISWGGQIIFTEETLNFLDLPSGANIRDLGLHSLKEIEGTVHVFELLHPHLPSADHPPLRSVALHLVNFPVQSLPFIGREKELAELVELVRSAETRLISLIGPGGCGKTRLAVQLSTQVADQFPDGIFFISLAPVQDPDLIPIVLADTLKFSFYGPRNHIEQLLSYLHRKKMLLVFDNLEHLRTEGAKFLAKVSSETHHIKLLVTSRERMNLLVETVFEVTGLPVPIKGEIDVPEDYSSIQLFIRNAQRLSPKFQYANNSAAILRICQLVDGLPLGIILASSWIRTYSCHDIAQEISKNLDFLATSSTDIEPRHHSLRAVFENSWQLLTDSERLIQARLSIFRSTFSAQAAEAICGASVQSLANLVDKSLLRLEPDGRFVLLETFRQYATDKLLALGDEYQQALSNFCRYYSDYCIRKQAELNTTGQRRALKEMTAEIENIRVAWGSLVEAGSWEIIDQVSVSLHTYHVMIGNYIQARELFRLAAKALGEPSEPHLRLIHGVLKLQEAWMTVKSGFVIEGLPCLIESLELFKSYNSHWNTVMTLMFLADTHHLLGNPLLGQKYIEDAIRLCHQQALNNSNYENAILAHCKSVYGQLMIDLGEYETARSYLQESISEHHRIGTDYGTIHPLLGLGKIAYILGEFSHARDLYLETLNTAANIYDQRGMAVIHNNLAAVFENTVSITESYHHVLMAWQLCRDTGDRRLTAIIMNNLAYHQLRYLHNPAEAIRTYQECIQLLVNLGDLRGIAYAYYDISKAYLQVGLVAEAWDYCLQSLRTSMTLDSTAQILHSLHGFVTVFASTRDSSRALRLANLIVHHPQTEEDTQKRAIVSKAVLEAELPEDVIQSAQVWAESASLQDVISLLLAEKQPVDKTISSSPDRLPSH